MSDDDITYYRKRAATERSRATDAPTDELKAVHLKLAIMYENLLDRLDQSGTAQDLEPPAHTQEQAL
jgi:hypothetical protein